jgi:hypothetical protein
VARDSHRKNGCQPFGLEGVSGYGYPDSRYIPMKRWLSSSLRIGQTRPTTSGSHLSALPETFFSPIPLAQRPRKKEKKHL